MLVQNSSIAILFDQACYDSILERYLSHFDLCVVTDNPINVSNLLEGLGSLVYLRISDDFVLKNPKIKALSLNLKNRPVVRDVIKQCLLDHPHLPFGLLADSILALVSQDKLPNKLSQDLVHKISLDNVMLSQAINRAPFFYFNVFFDTPEFCLDHHALHIEGIRIFEALRQAALAAFHLSGLPLSQRVTLNTSSIKFYRYINRLEPVVVRAFLWVPDDGTHPYALLQMYQIGHLCAMAEIDTNAVFVDNRVVSRLQASQEKKWQKELHHFENQISQIRTNNKSQQKFSDVYCKETEI
jgi:hypothetical protein